MEKKFKGKYYICKYSLKCFSDDSLNLTIDKFCSNLIKLSVVIKYYELETLKMIFDNCQDFRKY